MNKFARNHHIRHVFRNIHIYIGLIAWPLFFVILCKVIFFPTERPVSEEDRTIVLDVPSPDQTWTARVDEETYAAGFATDRAAIVSIRRISESPKFVQILNVNTGSGEIYMPKLHWNSYNSLDVTIYEPLSVWVDNLDYPGVDISLRLDPVAQEARRQDRKRAFDEVRKIEQREHRKIGISPLSGYPPYSAAGELPR